MTEIFLSRFMYLEVADQPATRERQRETNRACGRQRRRERGRGVQGCGMMGQQEGEEMGEDSKKEQTDRYLVTTQYRANLLDGADQQSNCSLKQVLTWCTHFLLGPLAINCPGRNARLIFISAMYVRVSKHFMIHLSTFQFSENCPASPLCFCNV